ncbi:MAG: transposase [Dehalococcoidia bacterium]
MRLDDSQREAVSAEVRSVCAFHGWQSLAVNVRTNHVHVVVAADAAPDRVLVALKARTTRLLRESGAIGAKVQPWSRGGSKRILWREGDVEAAVDYVLNRQ